MTVANDQDVAIGIGQLEGPMGRTISDDSYREPLRLPFFMGGIKVLHHEVPSDWGGRRVLGVVADRKVRPASHLEHSETLPHLDRAHANPLVEVSRDGRVASPKGDVAGPNRWTKIRRSPHESESTRDHQKA
jgi:hypothetical protein